jgi:glycosyltransferase involved in cell wall biosynthesis
LRIVIATDAWHPQVNGVVRSIAATVEGMRVIGHDVTVIEPSAFRNWPCPTYPEIRLALGCARAVARKLDALDPEAIHISTEGPVGLAARRWCLKRGRPFTTCFHTRFPDYLAARTRLPAGLFWPLMRLFHQPATRTFVATRSLARELDSRRIGPIHLWPRGVDRGCFSPGLTAHPALADLPRPILLNVGRVAVEKNITAFLSLVTAGTKVVVGDGPALGELKARFPETHFLGPLHGAELASAYAGADVFVFPSRTDTFGLVNIEALACGVPVAAFPVPGPGDILGKDGRGIHGGTASIGALDEDLGRAIVRALVADRAAAANEAAHYSWERCTDRFVSGLAPH